VYHSLEQSVSLGWYTRVSKDTRPSPPTTLFRMRMVREDENFSSVVGRLTNTLGLVKDRVEEVVTQLTSSADVPPISMKCDAMTSPVVMSIGCERHPRPSSADNAHSNRYIMQLCRRTALNMMDRVPVTELSI